MPSNKPKVQVLLTTQYFEKLKSLADKEERSLSQMSSRIIEKFIDNYEKDNGIIKNVNIESSRDFNINM